MPAQHEVLIWVGGPGTLPPEFIRALEAQGIAAQMHIGTEAPAEFANVVVRWCDGFVSVDLAMAVDLLMRNVARAVVVVASGIPALPPEAMRPGLLLVDVNAGERTVATMTATALVNAQQIAEQEQERIRVKDVSDAQESLVAIASHDLRTPVSTLRLLHDLFRSGLSAAIMPQKNKKFDIDELLEIFERNLDKMETFIDDILEASRLYRGRADVTVEPVSLNPVVEDAIAGLFPVAMQKDIVLDFVKEKKIPSVLGEPSRIGQVVTNLVGNALKYTPHGGSVTVHTRTVDGGAQLEVIDTGPGIPDEDKDRIFKRFSRGSALATGGEPSTGLGLFICREIVDLYGGKIWYESKPGQGCRFFVFWPSAAEV